MKRRFFDLLMGLALIGSFAIGLPSDASADDSLCYELSEAQMYHVKQGNDEYFAQLTEWFNIRYGCGRAPDTARLA